ncbi:CHC2 zinc finger domain-containing protein [Accumulibacter sp.]|uniref:CHC2 zinc finger domain-containing protein n=1 Tax=Accumulibacter sp. TaxID=2053492 RepID=UPI001A367A3B|nr:CHC2 zinc finger domain-containing protein [Accumulibacter sp.]MBL8402706.1 DNA primase [Accumulibacter sp.]
MSAAIDNLLARLGKVKRTGAGTWTACCPAHDDRGPSLAVRELDDGRILLHCFSGCTVHEVLAAVDLDISDLFPARALDHPAKPERRPFPAADCLRAVGFEALVVCSAAVALLAGEPFSEIDRERLILAASRIQAALTAGGLSYE